MATAHYLKLILIRHAQSLGNLQGMMEGQSSTELSALGHQQAQQLSTHLLQSVTEKLAEKLAEPTTSLHLYSSPLQRAIQTTQPIIQALQQSQCHFQIHQTDALQELHQGIFQGLTWAQAQTQHPQLCHQLLSSMQWLAVPEAESLVAARHRAQSWVKHLLNQHPPGDTVWAVSHEGFLQHLISVVMGCDRTWKIPIAHTALFEFWLSAAAPRLSRHRATPEDRFNPEHWIIRRFNDSSHLKMNS